MEIAIKPECIGFIMDGNRRWAREHGLDTYLGHKAGEEKFFEVAAWLKESGIKHSVFYAFSTENWKRSEAEVDYLMSLFSEALNQIESVRVKIIGDVERFNPTLQSKIKSLEEKTEQFESMGTIWIALSYGGRAEIINAVNKIIAAQDEKVDEKSFEKYLWTEDMPDPDIIIRTGGDMRMSNFLPWQSVYSELVFIQTHWPAFTKREFTRIVAAYGDRQRRYGQ
jgi:undecaprenyl diphosphate synthase